MSTYFKTRIASSWKKRVEGQLERIALRVGRHRLRLDLTRHSDIVYFQFYNHCTLLTRAFNCGSFLFFISKFPLYQVPGTTIYGIRWLKMVWLVHKLPNADCRLRNKSIHYKPQNSKLRTVALYHFIFIDFIYFLIPPWFLIYSFIFSKFFNPSLCE